MRKKLVLLSVFVAFLVFMHYFNKHHILNCEKDIVQLEKICAAERLVNSDLKLEYIRLSARERILKYAEQKLDMVLPDQSNNSVHYVKETRLSDETKRFSLIDFFVPSMEALTRK